MTQMRRHYKQELKELKQGSATATVAAIEAQGLPELKHLMLIAFAEAHCMSQVLNDLERKLATGSKQTE